MAPKKPAAIKHYLVFDVDSHSVGGGLFRIGYDAAGAVVSHEELSSVRKAITKGEIYPFERFFDATLKTLKQVATQIQKDALIPIEDLYLNVGAPWLSAERRITKKHYDRETTVTQADVSGIEDQIKDYDLKKNRVYKDHRVVVVDVMTTDYYANGYPVRDLVGKALTNLEIHSLVSVMSVTTKDAFTKVIHEVFHREPTMLSNTAIGYLAIRHLTPHLNDVILLDLSGETTELSVIKDDHLVGIGSVPVGTRHVVRTFQNGLDTSFKEAAAMLKRSAEGRLDDDYEQRIRPILERAFESWFDSFYELINRFSSEGLLPHTMVMKGHREDLAWFKERLLADDHLRAHFAGRADIEMVDLPVEPGDHELGIVAAVIGLKLISR